MNTEEVDKGVNGPMKTTGTNSTSIVEKEAQIFFEEWFVTCRYSWEQGLIDNSEMEKFCTVVPCWEFTF